MSAATEIDLRASDADRERAVERLRTAAAEGRIDAGELDRRVQDALGARTVAQLARLVADLPATPPRATSTSPRSPRGPRPEVQAFLVAHAVMIAIWALTGFGYFWVIWPLLGWGIPLLARGRRGLSCGRSTPRRSCAGLRASR